MPPKTWIEYLELIRDNLPSGRNHFSNPYLEETLKTLGVKPNIIGTEKVNVPTYRNITQQNSEMLKIFNKKYKTDPYYSSMPREYALSKFTEEWNKRNDPTKIKVNELKKYIAHQNSVYGANISPFVENAMISAIRNYPGIKLNFTPITNTNFPKYSTDAGVGSIPTYFSPQSYRGISNIDSLFGNAEALKDIAPYLAMQSLRAGLKDAAALAKVPGAERTVFPYEKKQPKVETVPTIFPSNPNDYVSNSFGVKPYYSYNHYTKANEKVDLPLRYANYAVQNGMYDDAEKIAKEGLSSAAWYAKVPGAELTHSQYNTVGHTNYTKAKFPNNLANQVIDYAKANGIWEPWMTTKSGLFSTWFPKKASDELKEFYESLLKK